jgi:hypothetical protein
MSYKNEPNAHQSTAFPCNGEFNLSGAEIFRKLIKINHKILLQTLILWSFKEKGYANSVQNTGLGPPEISQKNMSARSDENVFWLQISLFI